MGKRRAPKADLAPFPESRWTAYLLPSFALLLILLAVAVRIRLIDTPLERDEGEYAYTGQLMLQGVPPYRLAANMKLPGTHASYALNMAIFGQTIAGIHTGFLLVNLATIAIVFLLGRRLLDTSGGLVAAGSYALLSLGAGIYGTSAHATHFVLLPALGGTLLLLKWHDSRRFAHLFASGLLCGIAFLMKQPGIVFAAFGAGYLIWVTRQERHPGLGTWIGRLAIFGGAAALPFAAMCLLLWRTGDFASFWFWTVSYGRHYGSMTSLIGGAKSFLRTLPAVVEANWGFWFLAAAGLVMAWRKAERRRFAWYSTSLLVLSFVGVSFGLYYREHYFVLLLPSVAMLAGAAVTYWRPAAWLFAGVAIVSVGMRQEYLFQLDPVQVSRAMYAENPFPEAIKIGEYLDTHANKDARIAVLGSEPEICFYARRRSASSFLYTYGLMEPHPYALEMQEQMVRDLEAVRPEYVVMTTIYKSWVRRPESPKRLDEWWQVYGAANYQLEGVVDIISPTQTEYRWGAEAASYRSQSPNLVFVLKRKPG